MRGSFLVLDNREISWRGEAVLRGGESQGDEAEPRHPACGTAPGRHGHIGVQLGKIGASGTRSGVRAGIGLSPVVSFVSRSTPKVFASERTGYRLSSLRDGSGG